MNSPEAAEVLDMFADMIKTEEAVALNIGDDTPGSALFKTGKIAMFQSAMWSKTGIDESGINYGVAPLPAFGDKPVHSVIGASGLSISANAPKTRAGLEIRQVLLHPRSGRDAHERPADPHFGGRKAGPGDRPDHQALLRHAGRVQPRDQRLPEEPELGPDPGQPGLAIEAVMVEQGNAKAHLDEAVAASARFLN
jgi:multiple sugar transport system substrate-binding protein